MSDSNDATPILWAAECEIELHKSLFRQGDINSLNSDGETLILSYPTVDMRG